jgi:GINS complex subunit 1
MNYGNRAKELLLELKRSDFIPPYNDALVRSSLNEIQLHGDEITDLANAVKKSNPEKADKAPQGMRPKFILHNDAIMRNKRCLLAYHKYRLDKLQRWRWDSGAALPSYVRNLMSEAEVDFYMGYDKLISRFNESIGEISPGFDLNANMQPPEEDLVEVRVVKAGLGSIITEYYGEVALELGTTHFLNRGDVEHLIRQGALQQLISE